jgi:uncharacterized repeat protein (TIGR01451 family)
MLAAVSSSTGSFTVQASPSLLLSATTESKTGQPSDSLWYAVTVTNTGNSTDFIDITTSSTLGFTNIIWLDANNDGIPGNNGDYVLTDTDNDGKVDTPTLTAGSSANIIVVVVVSPGTADMSADVTTVTFASNTDPSVTATSTLNTTAHAPVLTIVKSVSPTGAQPPGTVLTYMVTVTNTGHGSATELQLIDIVPNNTTYVANSITVDGSSRTDAADGDDASIQSSSVIASFTSLGPGGTKTLTFQVQID